jgi:glycosyltransferase involved in cell wall biosynthesis
MKILVSSIVDLEKTAHNRLHQFIKHLSTNHEITVLSINDWWKTSQTDTNIYNKDFRDVLGKIRIEKFSRRKASPIHQEILSIRTIPKLLKEVGYRDFDVHLNYNTLFSGYFVAKKMHSIGICTIYDLADDLPEMIRTSPQINYLFRNIGGFVGTIMVRKNIALARKVTHTTLSLKSDYSITDEKSELLPNGVDIDLFKNYDSDGIKERLDITDDFVIGYVGVLREWVDLRPIFEAVKDIEKEYKVKLLIVGEEGRLKENKSLAEKLGIRDKVMFTGTVPYTEVPKYISSMDVCLIPFDTGGVSRNALPLKLFEYMACKKPVISTKLIGVEDAVGDRVFYASDKEQFKDQIIRLYNDDDLRKKMGTEGRKFVEQNYSWSKITGLLDAILEENIGG